MITQDDHKHLYQTNLLSFKNHKNFVVLLVAGSQDAIITVKLWKILTHICRYVQECTCAIFSLNKSVKHSHSASLS